MLFSRWMYIHLMYIHVPDDRECGNLEGVESDVDILIPEVQYRISLAY